MEESVDRDWGSFPSTALVQIFKNLGLEDRLLGVPLVCRSWNHASKDPCCWESMLPLNVSVENFFIKDPDQYHLIRSFTTRNFPALVERANGNITTLFLSAVKSNFYEDNTLAFIADRCPRLKHLSLKGFRVEKSKEGLPEVMRKCRDLELLDLDQDSSFSEAETVERMGRCWPRLRGLRWSGNLFYGNYTQASAIAASFPQLELLNLSLSTLCNQGLSSILEGCGALQFLDVRDCYYLTVDGDIRERSARIRDFCFDEKYVAPPNAQQRRFWTCCGSPCYGSPECFSCPSPDNVYVDYRRSMILKKRALRRG